MFSRGKRAVEAAQGITRKPRLSPAQSARLWCSREEDQDGLEKGFVSQYIGFGVFTTKVFHKGDFILEYCGKRISSKEAQNIDHNYLFGFKFGGKYIWIDGWDTDRLGRFINDAVEGSSACNSKMRMQLFQSTPHICLFASRTINIGEEIRYDYGDDSGNLFWRYRKNTIDIWKSTRFIVLISASNFSEDDDPFDVEKERKENENIIEKAPNFSEDDELFDVEKERNQMESKIEKAPNFSENDEPFDVVKERNQTERTVETAPYFPEIDEPFDVEKERDPNESTIETAPDFSENDEPFDVVKERNQTERTIETAPNFSENDEPFDVVKERNQTERTVETAPNFSENDEPFDVVKERNQTERTVETAPNFSENDEPFDVVKERNQTERTVETAPNFSENDEPFDVVKERNQTESRVETAPYFPEIDEPFNVEKERDPNESTIETAPNFSENDEPFDVVKERNQTERTIETDDVDNRDSNEVMVMFLDMEVNKGFLKLFPNLQLTTAEEASVIVVPTDKKKMAKASFRLIQALVGRRRHIVSHRWVKDSLKTGILQEISMYNVEGCYSYGSWTTTENYKPFEYEIRSGTFLDTTEGEVRQLIGAIGGTEVLVPSRNTIAVCADGDLLTSDRCVHKEWLYHCIINGEIVHPSFYHDDVVEESETESTIYPEIGTVKKGIRIQQSHSGSNSKRTQKLQCCIYCEALCTKLSRHLTLCHSNESEVARVLAYDKHSNHRRRGWLNLAAKGNALHNDKVKETGNGTLIPKYRPRAGSCTALKEYLSCEFCNALYVKTDLWKHHRSCPSKPAGVKSDAPVKNSRLLEPCNVNCSDELNNNILSNMRNDSVSITVKSDQLILSYGQRRFDKTGKKIHTHHSISNKMRELGKLTQNMKTMDSSVGSLCECLTPTRWEFILKSLKSVCGFEESSQTFTKASLAISLGESLKKCAKIHRNNAMKIGDDKVKGAAEQFLEIFDEEWTDRIGSHARETLADRKYNKPQCLPMVEDVQKVVKYIEKEIERVDCVTDKTERFTKMATLTLAQIVLFNRKRSGEASRLSKASYENAMKSQPPIDTEIKESLSKFEQELAQTHIRVETKGKKGRKVAIILTQDMKQNIDKLLRLCSPSTTNIFQKPNTRYPIRATDALRNVVSQAGVKSSITSTNLRKQLATMSQVLCLTENDQDILARFMGHDLQIHRQYYRLPQDTLEVAKVTKILHALNKGKISELKGKDLDTIDVMEPLESESDESDDEDMEHVTALPAAESSMSSESEDEPPCKKRCQVKRRNYVKTPWTKEEKSAVHNELRKCFAMKVLPKKLDCENVIRKHHCLKRRTWTMVKGYVRTTLASLERKKLK